MQEKSHSKKNKDKLSNETKKLTNKQRERKINRKILYVQEFLTHFYVVTYYIKWVKTSWTYSRQSTQKDLKKDEHTLHLK